MSTEKSSHLLAKLAERLEIGALPLNEANIGSFAVGGFPIFVQYRPEHEDFLLSAQIAESEVDANRNFLFYSELLIANFGGDGTKKAFFSLDEATGIVWLQRIIPLLKLDSDELGNVCESFSITALEYAEALGGVAEIITEESPESARNPEKEVRSVRDFL